MCALLLQLNKYNWLVEPISGVGESEGTSHGENKIHMCRQLQNSMRQIMRHQTLNSLTVILGEINMDQNGEDGFMGSLRSEKWGMKNEY